MKPPARAFVPPSCAAVDLFAFERGEEALAHGVVVGVLHRSSRRPHAGLLAAIAEDDRRMLRTAIGMMDGVLWPARGERHVEGVENDARLQVRREGPADDAAGPGIEDDGQIEDADQRRNERDLGDP